MDGEGKDGRESVFHPHQGETFPAAPIPYSWEVSICFQERFLDWGGGVGAGGLCLEGEASILIAPTLAKIITTII